jgi:hypothetical protein
LSSGFLLELLNGNWGIAAAALTIICGIYLSHEAVARRIPLWDRERMTLGMRVSVGLFFLSLGVAIRSAEVYFWRRLGGDNLGDLSQGWLILGSGIALVGFLCCIRVISRPLYGNRPWIWTLVVMIAFTVASIAYHVATRFP